MELAQLAPALLIAPFILLVIFVSGVFAPGLVMLVVAIWWLRKRRHQRRHRFDPFIVRMLE